MTNKERFVEYAKKHNIAENEEVLDRRLAIIPEMSRNIVETRWGLNGGKYCQRFASLDKVLGINDSKEAYLKAMQDLQNAGSAELISDREELGNWDVTCGLGSLARAIFGVDPNASEPNLIRGTGMLEALEILPKVEKDTITFRFGLDGNGRKCLQDVADIMGVTREKVKGRENKIIKKLRNRSYAVLFWIPYFVENERNTEEAMFVEDATDISQKSVVDIYDFSFRTFNCLRRAGINTVGDILINTSKLLTVRNFDEKTAKEVIKFLESEPLSNTDCGTPKKILEEFILCKRK